jgi:hypothetical protein
VLLDGDADHTNVRLVITVRLRPYFVNTFDLSFA